MHSQTTPPVLDIYKTHSQCTAAEEYPISLVLSAKYGEGGLTCTTSHVTVKSYIWPVGFCKFGATQAVPNTIWNPSHAGILFHDTVDTLTGKFLYDGVDRRKWYLKIKSSFPLIIPIEINSCPLGNRIYQER